MNEIEYEAHQSAPRPDEGVDEQSDQELDWLAKRRDRLNVATQETRFQILQKIIGHPKQLPTRKELDYFMRDVSMSTIRNHLDKLIEAGVVAQVELPDDQRTRDNPHVFYGLTEVGRDDLEDANLLLAEDLAQEATLSVEVPADVERYLQAPRPEWKPARPYEPAADE